MKLVAVFTLALTGLLFGCASAPYGGAKGNQFAAEIPPLTSSTHIILLPALPFFGVTLDEADAINREVYYQLLALNSNIILPDVNTKDDPEFFLLNLLNNAQAPSHSREWYEPFIKKIGKEGVYIIPSIIRRAATIKGKLVSWDGAEQDMRVEGGDGLGNWSGKRMAYSLKLEVFDSNGVWLMTSLGGISFPDVAIIRTRELQRKDRLFENKNDQAVLTRGVKVALWPFQQGFNIPKELRAE